MKTAINLAILVVLSLGLALGSSSHFSEYLAKRNFSADVNYKNDSLISCYCIENKTLVLSFGERFMLINITNHLGEEGVFYIYDDSGILDYENTHYLMPEESKEVYAYFYGFPGFYTINVYVSAEWENGSAFLYACRVNISSPTVKIEKQLFSGPETVKVGEKAQWTLRILLENNGRTNCYQIVDTIPAELEVVNTNPSKGIVNVQKNGKGKMGSTRLLWSVSLNNSENAFLDITISTTQNPAGKQEFTSPGYYCLNDGAEVVGYGIKSNSICIYVYEDELKEKHKESKSSEKKDSEKDS